MVCVNCGKNLIRGYAFCMECGSPVPPEVLEEGGMPGRTDDEGRPKPEAENTAEKSEKGDNAEEREQPVSEVRSSMPGIEPLNGGNTEETLVFCPNCGMHMQNDPYRCNICGKKLIDKPKNVPLSAGGVPLMNVNLMAGMGGIGGGLDGISDSDIEQISSFMSGTGNIPIFAAEEESTPDLFGSDISANDFAALSEQLANFSAANEMPGIEAIDAPKHEPKAEAERPPIERRVDDFNMGGDSAAAALSDNAVPVIDNYSMDEDPSENVNLDPYKFLDASMEDAPEPLFSQPQTVRTPPPAPVKEPETKPEQPVYEPVFSQSKPAEPPMHEAPVRMPEPAPQAAKVVQTPKAPEPPVFPEAAPVIEETAPVISEYVPEQSAPQAPSAPKAPETADPYNDVFNQPVPPPMPRQNTASVQSEAPHGNLFRCQFCGQSMYDTDKFCPSCGASYKNGSSSSKRKSKAPLIIGIAAAVIVLAAGGYFAMNILNNGNGGESLPSNSSSSVVSDTSEAEESSQTEESTESESSEPSASSTGGAPNSSAGAPNSSTGTPPSSTGAPNGSGSSSSTGGPPSSTGAPNGSNSSSSTGGPPSSTGAPNGSSSSSSTGGPPSSTGAPNGSGSPSSTGGPPSSTGAPNGSSGPSSTGALPSSTGAPNGSGSPSSKGGSSSSTSAPSSSR